MPLKEYGEGLRLVEYDNAADRVANSSDFGVADRGQVLVIDRDTGKIWLWDGDSYRPFGDATSTEAQNWWVRDADGDDNGDGTSANPFATLAALNDRLPRVQQADHPIIIHLGSGNYTLGELLTGRNFGGPVALIGDGAGGASDDGFTVIQAAELADGTSTTTLLAKVGGGLTPDDATMLFKTIDITAGTGAGQRRTVNEITAAGFIPSKAFSPAPDGTSTYRIVEPAVVLDIPASGKIHSTSPQSALSGNPDDVASINLVNLQLSGEDASFANIEFTTCTVNAFGVEMVDGGSGIALSLNGCLFQPGLTDEVLVGLGIIGSSDLWEGWGFADLSSGGASGFDALVSGYLVSNAARSFFGGVNYSIQGGRIQGRLTLSGLIGDNLTAVFTGAHPTALEGLTVDQRVHCRFAGANSELGGTGDRIVVKNGASLNLGSGVTLRGTVTSPDRIVQAEYGGNVYLEGQPDASMVNSGANGYDVGDGTPAGRAAFGSGAGDVEFNASDGSRILRVS